ncbi:MAG: N-6 DNA methylase [Candidatus Moraniibacteriota bacterium]
MNIETKRHIDGARQVLVGVVPNPTSQIDQITNALIYKFMDDMDQSAIKQGDEPSFFVGDLEKYAWTRLMDSRMGNQERMNLYSEALLKFSESKQLPELFRGIFKSAFLPYRSPEVLGLFLKEIDFFDYSHPEELGNAYEYLLSIMSSQGDAGQFRTPRHIIDFIVDVVNPTKDDKVLDPACGTGGFLVSAYNQILEQHDGKNDPEKKEKALTPDQRRNLMNNFEGYDVDPGMVRIAQVNMYLHQFKNPKIVQYDTLSMEERWGDKFDVILANPPFMSPKGGVKTHSKFSVQSSRSEVLFVDYIMNHLRPKGRAGIIVPEGIIFQSGKSHKELRKNLVNDGLYAVVSLPSGIFNPYAGVKTSILFFNNELAKINKEILFIKIENDGFDLGAQRREIQKNDLPQAVKILSEWKNSSVISAQAGIQCIAVSKSKISENGDYNLSGDRYRVATDYSNAKWPMVAIEDLCDLGRGRVISKKDMELNPGPFPVFSSQTTDNGTFGYLGTYDFDGEYATWTTDGANAGTVFYRNGKFNCTNVCGTLKAKSININMKYLAKALNAIAYEYVIQVGNPKLMNNVVAKIKIPLPPLEIQEQIVAELDGYANIIAGAKQIAQNWKPKIDIDPEWEKSELSKLCKFTQGVQIPQDEQINEYREGYKRYIYISDLMHDERVIYVKDKYPNKEVGKKDLIMVNTGNTSGNVFWGKSGVLSNNVFKINHNEKLDTKFLYFYLVSDQFYKDLSKHFKQGAQPHLGHKIIGEQVIFVPPLEIQEQIVKKIEAERVLVESAKKLIGIYEGKTKEVIGKLWEE